MRVLVVAAPLLGHLSPLLPLASALRAAGHDVLLAAGGDAMRLDTGGIPVRDVATRLRLVPIALRLTIAQPRLSRLEFSGRAGTELAGLLFGAIAEKLADDTVALAREWRPDLVVHEPFAMGGAIAASAVGVPAVTHGCNLWDERELSAAVAGSEAFRRAARRHGVDALPPSVEVVGIAPPSLVGPRPGRFVRAIAPSGVGELPTWLAGPGDRPRVLVSRSTTGSGPGGNPMPAVIRAAPHVDADFVLVRGPGRGTLPPNVHVTGWIPLDRAMAHATAFVHHGGAGGLLQALTAGLPQLVVPGAADRRFNAELLERRGAGLAVPGRRITPEVLTRLVTDPGLRAAAAELRAEIAGMPDPSSLVAVLERVAGA